LCWLFSKSAISIIVVCKSKLCLKGSRPKIAGFYVARKW
jgi:hypothetical protein